MIRTTLLIVVVLIAADAPGQKPNSEYPPPPWHLVDVWWDIGQDMAFQSYSVDADISDDVPATKNLYIAPVGLAHLSKTAFYGGIQSQSDGYTKRDQILRQIGPGFIFSMWGERNLDAIRPSIGGFCQSSGHEGEFISVRRPYEWKKGKYTYKVVRMDKEEIDGKPFTWVGVLVYSHARDENVFVGALRFKGDNLVLARQVATFVEVYGERIPVGDIPKLTVTFGNLRVNTKPVKVVWADAVYPKDVPDYAEVTAKDSTLSVKVGQPVEDRKAAKRATDRQVTILATRGKRALTQHSRGDNHERFKRNALGPRRLHPLAVCFHRVTPFLLRQADSTDKVIRAISEFQAGNKADESPFCLTPTTFVSKDYVEEGWEIAVVRYPLREDLDEEIIQWAGELAAVLMKRFHQEHITAVIRDELVIFAKE